MRPMPELKVVNVPTDELVEYRNNAKLHPMEQVDQIAASIEEFGFNSPILAWHNDDGDPEIVAGHGRLMAARKLGMQELPVVFLDHMTDEQRRAYILVDNQLTMNSGFDDEVLNVEMSNIIDIDMSQFDFDIELDDEVFDEGDGEVEEDEVPEDAPSLVHLGDVWQLGRHRLMCGDSTDPAVVERLMDGAKAELLLTDPPYGIDVVCHNTKKNGWDKPITTGTTHGKAKNAITNAKEYAPIIGDDTTDTARANYGVALTCTKNQIIFGGNYFTDFLPPSRCWIVWDKENSGTFADAELAWTSFDKVVKLYHFMWNGLCREGSREVEGKTRVHPTQKPVGMLANILKDFSEENDNILDCFGGSGSTLIACEQLNRRCYMMELDPHYCDVIIERWQNLTGETARKVEQDG